MTKFMDPMEASLTRQKVVSNNQIKVLKVLSQYLVFVIEAPNFRGFEFSRLSHNQVQVYNPASLT